jgi:hypothetical protein
MPAPVGSAKNNQAASRLVVERYRLRRGVEVMLTIDAQVHAYERNHPGRPWIGTVYGPTEVTGDQMVAAMDAVGVDGAILVSPFSMYRYDAGYALEVFAAHPNRFRLSSRWIRPTPRSPIQSPIGPPERARWASGSS